MNTPQNTDRDSVESSALLASLPPHDRWMIEAINKPEFDKATRVHDWRNHVPKTIEKVWSHLSEEARLVAIMMAEEEASNENWE
jgi:hypothetical protein